MFTEWCHAALSISISKPLTGSFIGLNLRVGPCAATHLTLEEVGLKSPYIQVLQNFPKELYYTVGGSKLLSIGWLNS